MDKIIQKIQIIILQINNKRIKISYFKIKKNSNNNFNHLPLKEKIIKVKYQIVHFQMKNNMEQLKNKLKGVNPYIKIKQNSKKSKIQYNQIKKRVGVRVKIIN